MKNELEVITTFYAGKTAARSGVPLINHIHEGITVMVAEAAPAVAIAAYCLHPLLQRDEDLLSNINRLNVLGVQPAAIALAMEYRAVANAWLSDKVGPGTLLQGEPKLSPLASVNKMLVADKVQNRKDFEKYHKGTHPRSVQLEKYFSVWLHVLGIDEDAYQRLCWLIDNAEGQ